jgi:hypothetical protein
VVVSSLKGLPAQRFAEQTDPTRTHTVISLEHHSAPGGQNRAPAGKGLQTATPVSISKAVWSL